MGEKSKIIGEYGETAVENFLKLIGWGSAPNNIEFKCIRPTKHDNARTHGLDFYFAYKSPLVDSVLKSVSISVKFSNKVYLNSPNSKFKEYVKDLATAIECCKNSDEVVRFVASINGYSKTEETGVLFWLSNNEETYDDLITKISTAQLTLDNQFHSLYVVDNKRIEFIYKSIAFAKARFFNSEILFYYPDTGKNILPTVKKNCGKILPVEYINSSILPLRIQDKDSGKTTLALFTIDSFEPRDLKRLIGLAQDISKSWSSGVMIAFPNYNALNHSNDVKAAKLIYENNELIENLEIVSYNDSFTSLQND